MRLASALGAATMAGLMLAPPASAATFTLKGSSPAVDYQPGCSAGVGQRGFSRPVGAGCDIGSFERGASAP